MGEPQSNCETKCLPDTADVVAPDGSEVCVLSQVSRGSMAHFKLAPGQVSKAVAHRTIEELWYIVSGSGRMWRQLEGDESIVELRSGVSLAIPIGAHFQFRSDSEDSLEAIGVAMPPWPGDDEAYEVMGPWKATV